MTQNTRIAGPPRTLVEGQRLDQHTFHSLYEAMPPGTRAELINGVVLMPSPVAPAHGRAHFPTIAWLSYYVENTPGLEGMDNTSTAMGLKGERHPDVLLRILPDRKRCHESRDVRSRHQGAAAGLHQLRPR